MEVDLNQLPVPAWGLRCARCQYLLDGLPSHRCPECGAGFDVSTLAGTWTQVRPPRFTGHELPIPDFGLTCLSCDAPLAGWSTHDCPSCGTRFDPDTERPAGGWFHADEGFCRPLLPPVVEMLVAEQQIPHLLTEERGVAALYMGRMSPPRLMISTAFFFEMLHLIREQAQQVAAAAADADREWHCSACGEASPWNFELCWKCEARRPGVASS
jgi:hypothetical protein